LRNVKKWLHPLLEPFVIEAYTILREQHKTRDAQHAKKVVSVAAGLDNTSPAAITSVQQPSSSNPGKKNQKKDQHVDTQSADADHTAVLPSESSSIPSSAPVAVVEVVSAPGHNKGKKQRNQNMTEALSSTTNAVQPTATPPAERSISKKKKSKHPGEVLDTAQDAVRDSEGDHQKTKKKAKKAKLAAVG
jgi:hypothetical protein